MANEWDESFVDARGDQSSSLIRSLARSLKNDQVGDDDDVYCLCRKERERDIEAETDLTLASRTLVAREKRERHELEYLFFLNKKKKCERNMKAAKSKN